MSTTKRELCCVCQHIKPCVFRTRHLYISSRSPHVCSECLDKPQYVEIPQHIRKWYNTCLYCRGEAIYAREKIVVEASGVGSYHRGCSVVLISGILCERCDSALVLLHTDQEAPIGLDLIWYERVVNTRLWWPDNIPPPSHRSLRRMSIPYQSLRSSLASQHQNLYRSIVDIVRSPLNGYGIRYLTKCIRDMVYDKRYRRHALIIIEMMRGLYEDLKSTVRSISSFASLSTKPGQFHPDILILDYLRDPMCVIIRQTEHAVKSLE